MKNAKIYLDVYDHDKVIINIQFKFGDKTWTIENWENFSSSKTAENQARKLAEKLGLNITETIAG